jgi:hypothetical protein
MAESLASCARRTDEIILFSMRVRTDAHWQHMWARAPRLKGHLSTEGISRYLWIIVDGNEVLKAAKKTINH